MLPSQAISATPLLVPQLSSLGVAMVRTNSGVGLVFPFSLPRCNGLDATRPEHRGARRGRSLRGRGNGFLLGVRES